MKPSTSEARRPLMYLFSLSMFLLFLSCYFFIGSTSNSLIPNSVFIGVLVNRTSASNGNTDTNKLPRAPSIASRDSNISMSSNRDGFSWSSNSNKESRVLGQRKGKECIPNEALLRVYMYDLPPMFHFGLLNWRGKGSQIWPDAARIHSVPGYPGGLNLQHSIEYWLTLDLLYSNIPGIVRPCNAIRVENTSLADVIFVPFFASLSYNRHSRLESKEKISRNKFLQDELVKFLMNRDEWKRLNGKDHIIVAHHPNSMLNARRKLGSAMFVLADFGRYPAKIANIKKDIIAPYKHVVKSIGNDSAPFEGRQILVYFQGAIKRKDGGVIRQTLYNLLKDEKDVHFLYGSVMGNGIRRASRGMASSRFCLNIAGDTPSSNRLFDAIASHCVPVIISDDIELPFEDVLDYTEFCIFVRASDAVKKGFLMNLLRRVGREQWTKMWGRLKQIAHHFEYQHPSQQGDAVQMIWEAVARKIPSVRLTLHRKNRYNRSQIMVDQKQS